MNTVHSATMRALIASLIGMSAGSTMALPSRSELSESQKRSYAKWEADAPRRAAEAREIAVWNAGVKRRNQAFATTGKNKHLRRAETA